MIKIVTHLSEGGIIIRWESLWNEIILDEGRVSFYYGVLELYQDPGQPLREKTGDCLFGEFLTGELNEQVEKHFGSDTLVQVKQSIKKISC